MPKSEVRLSIVIGALREERRIGSTLQKLHAFLEQNNMLDSTEIIVVAADGGDNTQSVVRSFQSSMPLLRLVEPGLPVGKGRDIQFGMLRATGPIRIFMDADAATPLHHLKTVLELWNGQEKPDIIAGVRDLHKIHDNITRRCISIVGNICFFLVSGYYFKDTQCGFKAFSADAAQTCFRRLTRLHWSFDMEILTIAKVHRLKIVKLPIKDWEEVPDGTFTGSLGDSLQFLKDLLVIFYLRHTNRYK